jgi:hypothetical protein
MKPLKGVLCTAGNVSITQQKDPNFHKVETGVLVLVENEVLFLRKIVFFARGWKNRN